MATSTLHLVRDHAVRVPRSVDNGLWNALAANLSNNSAGPRLTGPFRPGQPISRHGTRLVIDMAAFRDRVDPDPLTAA